jgi:hypothetical protein
MVTVPRDTHVEHAGDVDNRGHSAQGPGPKHWGSAERGARAREHFCAAGCAPLLCAHTLFACLQAALPGGSAMPTLPATPRRPARTSRPTTRYLQYLFPLQHRLLWLSRLTKTRVNACAPARTRPLTRTLLGSTVGGVPDRRRACPEGVATCCVYFGALLLMM